MDADRDDRSVIQPTVEATRPRSDTDRLAQTADQVFFIVGVGRSGTSLLQSMISSHPDAIMLNETKFYTVLRKHGQRFGDLRSPGAFEKAVDFTLTQWFIRALGMPEDQFRRMCDLGARSWDTIFMAILTLYAEKHGAARVGEKSPGHLSRIDHLQQSFPKARFVHIVRDPRAVVLSNLKARLPTRYIGPTVRRWQGAVSIHRQWSDRLGPMRYHLVRYEDLVSEPEQTLRAVSAFLGLEFSCQMLSPENRPVAGFSPRRPAGAPVRRRRRPGFR